MSKEISDSLDDKKDLLFDLIRNYKSQEKTEDELKNKIRALVFSYPDVIKSPELWFPQIGQGYFDGKNIDLKVYSILD